MKDFSSGILEAQRFQKRADRCWKAQKRWPEHIACKKVGEKRKMFQYLCVIKAAEFKNGVKSLEAYQKETQRVHRAKLAKAAKVRRNKKRYGGART